MLLNPGRLRLITRIFLALLLTLSAMSAAVFWLLQRNPEALADCVAISNEVMGGEYYKALMRCRKLMAYEDELLGIADVDPGLPARRDAV